MTQSPTQWSVRVDEYIQVVVLRNEFDDLRDILEADGEVDPYAWRKFSDAGSLVYLQAGLQFERVMPLTSLVRESLVVSWITRPECERDYPWIV